MFSIGDFLAVRLVSNGLESRIPDCVFKTFAHVFWLKNRLVPKQGVSYFRLRLCKFRTKYLVSYRFVCVSPKRRADTATRKATLCMFRKEAKSLQCVSLSVCGSQNYWSVRYHSGHRLIFSQFNSPTLYRINSLMVYCRVL